jgi:hypothetical protein
MAAASVKVPVLDTLTLPSARSSAEEEELAVNYHRYVGLVAIDERRRAITTR